MKHTKSYTAVHNYLFSSRKCGPCGLLNPAHLSLSPLPLLFLLLCQINDHLKKVYLLLPNSLNTTGWAHSASNFLLWESLILGDIKLKVALSQLRVNLGRISSFCIQDTCTQMLQMLWDNERAKTETRVYNGNSDAFLPSALQYYVSKNINIKSTYMFCYMQFI